MTLDPIAYFKMRKPCGNCPFLKEGAIGLRPGRLAGIIADLLADDHSSFYCHKTVHSGRTGGEWEEGAYQPTGKESMCAGAMIFLEKASRPNVAMRLGRVIRIYSPEALQPHFDLVVDPTPSDLTPKRLPQGRKKPRA